MNEVRQVWTSFRSPAKASTLATSNVSNASSANNCGGSTIWYDAPAPVIIHCREFRDDAGASVDASVDRKNEADGSKLEITSRMSTEVNSMPKEEEEEEVLYQNNVEATLNHLTRVRVEAPKVETRPKDHQVDESTIRKRHSNTLELTAATVVRTDSDGMPTISFSFLQTGEKLHADVVDSCAKEKMHENVRIIEIVPETDQLYDFPKSPTEDKKTCPIFPDVPKPGSQEHSPGDPNANSKDPDESIVRNELYDVPKSTDDLAGDDSVKKDQKRIDEKAPTEKVATVIELPRKRDHRERLKRSSRSLKTGRRSCGAPDSEDYDAGIASMSGSYSDPECPNEALSTSSSYRSGRLKLQKRRLGKAWGKMRSWLREEKTKIGEVVGRHAKMQAVGALINGDQNEDDGHKVSRSKCASYDLTKARTQEVGSITRVEEFGLSSVSEECRNSDVERPCSVSPDSGKASTREQKPKEEEEEAADEVVVDVDLDVDVSVNAEKEEKTRAIAGKRSLLRGKTASTDDILGNGSRSKLHPVSFSMDKLCSDTENEEVVLAGGAARASVIELTRDHGGKGGLIKRRMLGSIRGLMASTHLLQAAHEVDEGGQGGFEEVRRYVKQGGDFCKELAAILHERAELEATYAKGLSKLSGKLTKACTKDQGGNSSGGVNEAWRCVGEEMEAAAEAHRVWGIALEEQLAKPIRVGVAEAQGRSRKSIENSVDKASKSLQEWRGIASKSKKQSFACARENERLQDLARLQSISQSQQNNNKASNHHMTEKEANKLETRRRKAEDSSRRADTEFYTVSVRAERARLEYESTVRKGAKQMELLEEERLSALKDLANVYLAHLQALAPRLQQSADRLSAPIRNCNVAQDVEILRNLIRRIDDNEMSTAEQLLPDFYAEHVTLAMNRERRKQALVRVLRLIRQDLERERRGREGLETLHRAFVKTPAFAADESTQNVTEKLHHMRSMLLYLEAARYKVGGTLAEVEGSKRNKHPLADCILVSRDKQGLQQSVLKISSWAKNESLEIQDCDNDIVEHLTKDQENENRDWADRTAGDGNSENPPDEDDFSDFDEFSSHSEDNNNQDIDVAEVTTKLERAEQCRAIYQYSANLNDELSLNPGDLITVHQKQADGWWIGECRGRTGIFPATYVQVIH